MDLVIRATGSLLPKLVKLLKEEYKLQKRVKKQIKFIHDELENAQAVLHEVAEVPLDQLKEPVRIWARELREASYDMEDILDTFLVHVKGDAPDPEPANSGRLKRAVKKIVRLFPKMKARHSIAGDIDDITDHLQQVARRHRDYAVGDIKKPNAAASVIYPRLHAKFQDMTQQIVGIDESRDELISKLKSPQGGDVSNKKLKVVSVVGVGGLGKTTLARASYEKLKVDFGSCAFVSVGRDPVFKDVFKRILIDLDRKHYTSKDFDFSQMDEDILIEEIREFLRNKRYLIVIDDIWEKDSWKKIIKYAFDSDGNCGSRVITTTRKFDVAREADEVYKLQPLHGDFPKKLFYAIVEQSLNNQLDDAPDKFLKKCDGVPLAIITMASMLKNKRRGDWLQVYDSIGFDHEDCKEVDIMKILSTSYYDLYSRLQTCLLYLSVFPEDSFIDKKSLIRKWIAEGFIDQKPGLSLFEVGERYFEELIDRSMIHGVEGEVRDRRWCPYKIVVGCQVHDMVLDLIRSKAHEENFISIFNYSKGTCLQPGATVRRLVEQNRMEQHSTPQQFNHVRSFIASMSHFDKLAPLSSFKLLRVLDINDCKSVCHLEHIAHLLHLRYLGLRRLHNIRELPKEIGDLKLLQTLELGDMFIDELPSTLAHVKDLVCLRLTGISLMKMEPGTIRALTSLEKLELEARFFNCSRLFVKELGSLKSLRVLEAGIEIDDESMRMDFIEALRNLQELRSLQVWRAGIIRPPARAIRYTWEAAGLVLSRHLQCMYVHHKLTFSRLPSCIDGSHLPCLSSLQLSVHAMDDKDLELLGKLPELRCLNLRTGSTVTLNIQNGSACFQKLRFLSMDISMLQFLPTSFHMWNGEGDAPFIGCSKRKDYGCRVASAVIMPNLEELEFAAYGPRYCTKLGLENLPLLQKIVAYAEGVMRTKEIANVALWHACKAHPNSPSVHIINRQWRRAVDKAYAAQLEASRDLDKGSCIGGALVEWLAAVGSGVRQRRRGGVASGG